MRWDIWEHIEDLLTELAIKPIVAIVPDNQDETLRAQAPVDDFWDRARQWQSRGWTIGLHGFQHRYVSPHSGLVGIRKKSEFAGLPAADQAEKLRRGAAILAREKLTPKVWIAPGNTFDATTVSLLPQVGIRVIVDGYFSHPYVCRQGLTWVPQQLFSFRAARRGVWTVCYHHNQWNDLDLKTFREQVRGFRENIFSLEEVLRAYAGQNSAWSRHLCTSPRLSRFLVRARLKLWSWTEPARVPAASLVANG
jgi:predicted deacetylase